MTLGWNARGWLVAHAEKKSVSVANGMILGGALLMGVVVLNIFIPSLVRLNLDIFFIETAELI